MYQHTLKKLIVVFACCLGCFVAYGITEASADQEIVYAVVDDLSGPYAANGDENVKATTLALEELDYKVLGRPIRLVKRDTQLKPAVGVRKFREVVEQEKPIFVSSGCSSGVQLAMQPVAKETKTIFWTDGWATPLTTAGTVNRYTFRWSGTDFAVANSALTGFMKKFPNAKSYYAITMDYAWGHSMFEEVAKIIKDSGGTVLGNVLTPIKETDYSGAITKALAAKPDVVIIIQYGSPQIKCARAVHEFGVKDRAKVFIPATGITMLRGIGAEALEGMYVCTQWWYRLENDFSKAFVKKYKAKYNATPSYYAAAKYVEAILNLGAVERSKSTDVGKIICALEGYKYNGPSGSEEIRAFDHQVVHPLFLGVGKSRKQMKEDDDLLEIIGSGMVYRSKEQNPVVWDVKLPCD